MADLADDLAEWLMKRSLGPDWRRYATAYPLTAKGHHNDPDDWVGAGPRKRHDAPCITVYNGREWMATAMVSKTGRNPTIYVPKGTKVVEL